MREGRIIADGSPDDIKQRAGVDDVEAAFPRHRAPGTGVTRHEPPHHPRRRPPRPHPAARDKRTMAMLLVLPCVLISLLWWIYEDANLMLFDSIGPALLAIFPVI